VKLAKPQHEAFAQFFETPTREKLRDLIKLSIGESYYLDFKAEWPELIKVAKHILALSNSGGGALVLGLHQTSEGNIEVSGLNEIKDKVDIVKIIKKYIPASVHYDIFDFSYIDSEYQALKGKMFQVILVEYSENKLPLLSLKEGAGIKANIAYVRDGTESTEANHNQLEHLINLRVESGYSSSHTLELREHLDQLQTLYKARKEKENFYELSLSSALKSIYGDSLDEYYKFIEELIEYKKKRIRKELGE
jgi:predicted HTH transcriptional regulator